MNDHLQFLKDLLVSCEVNWKVPSNDSEPFQTTDPIEHLPLLELFPESSEKLLKIVRIFNKYEVAYHVVSRGQNWGYSDKNLIHGVDVLINLAEMKRIIEIDSKMGTVLVEPGVTQADLETYLKDFPNWIMDPTGSDRSSSLVGNYLERGFGHSSFGDHEVTGKIIKVLLPNGEFLTPHQGFSDYSRSRGLYQHDTGLNFEKLFYQTNFGIVTEYLIKLRPRPEQVMAVIVIANSDESAAALLEKISYLKKSGVILSCPHMGNSYRVNKSSEGTLKDQSWGMTIDISGPKDLVSVRKRLLRKELKDFEIHFFDTKTVSLVQKFDFLFPNSLKKQVQNIDSLLSLYSGRPTDYFFDLSFSRNRSKRKKSLWICPMFLPTLNDFSDLKATLESVLGGGRVAPVTISLVSDSCAVWISEIDGDDFPEDEIAILYGKIEAELKKKGFHFYRYGYRSGSQFLISETSPPPSSYLGFLKLAKKYFDEKNVLSPNRWGLHIDS